MQGLQWRSWTAADRAAVVYLLLQRFHADDLPALRDLYDLVDDRAAVGRIDRQIMGQDTKVQVNHG